MPRLLSIVKCARGEGDDSRRHRRAGGQMPRERFVPATSRALKGHQPNARHASGLLYVGKPWSKARSSIDPFFLSLRTYGLGFSCRAA
jgi:hypothetical protein